jgi:beta-D-xylosidase 4
MFALVCGLLAAKSVSASIPRACSTPETSKFPFCDTSLSIDDRIDDLISRIDIKYVPQLLTARSSPNNAIPELGLPEYDWGANCIHGVQSKCGKNCPTSFPSPNALGASFNRAGFRKMGEIISEELRALWLEGAEENGASTRPHIGLDCWSPNINLNRDPRWGRNQEVVSEDPLLSGVFGVEYTRGLQEGEDPRFLKGISTLKHWDAYSLENLGTKNRHNFDAKVSNFDFTDSYFKAFKASVMEGKAKGVMCSYNAVNGVPSCASTFLNNVLRNVWGFSGYITSDTGAVQDIYKNHKYTSTAENASGLALAAGTDIDSGSVYQKALINGLNTGVVNQDDVTTALRNTFRMRFELGLFDPIDDQPYWHVSPDAVNTPESQQFNLNITRQGIVLLKNDRSVLPLKKGSNIAVIGPHFNATGDLVGNYIGQICPKAYNDHSCIESPLQAITKINVGGKVSYAQGCDVSGTSTSGFTAALSAASEAETVIMFLGLDQTVERESHDRTSITLPGVQSQLFSQVVALGKPTVVVLVHGGAIAIEEIIASPASILDTFYAGFKGSQAIAEVLFGDYNPSGKLPVTVYPKDFVNAVDFGSMSMTEGDGRSYRYYQKQPLFEFGYGLSYTTFKLAMTSQPEKLTFEQAKPLHFEVSVSNTGSRLGSEVVLVYFSPVQLVGGFQTPLKKQLINFSRAEDIAPASQQTFSFDISADELALANENGDIVMVPGTYELTFSNGLEVVSQQVTIPGEGIVIMEKFPSEFLN